MVPRRLGISSWSGRQLTWVNEVGLWASNVCIWIHFVARTGHTTEHPADDVTHSSTYLPLLTGSGARHTFILHVVPILVLDKDKLFIKPLAWATGNWQPVLELISFDLCILEDIQDKGMGTNRPIQSIIAEPITESQPWFWNSRQNFHTGETLSTEMKWTMIQRNSSEIYNTDFIYHPQSFLLPFFFFHFILMYTFLYCP